MKNKKGSQDHNNLWSNNLKELEKLARDALLMKNYKDSIRYCDLAIEKDPQLSWSHLIRSYSLYGMKQVKECKPDARIAFELDKESWEPNFWWGTVLCFFDKNLDEGILFLEKAAHIEKNNWFLFKNLSAAYAKKRDWKNYHRVFGEMNRIRPSKFLSVFLLFAKIGGPQIFPIIYILLYFLFLASAVFLGLKPLLWIPGIMTTFLLALGVRTIQMDRKAGIIIFLACIIYGLGILIAYRLILF